MPGDDFFPFPFPYPSLMPRTVSHSSLLAPNHNAKQTLSTRPKAQDRTAKRLKNHQAAPPKALQSKEARGVLRQSLSLTSLTTQQQQLQLQRKPLTDSEMLDKLSEEKAPR